MRARIDLKLKGSNWPKLVHPLTAISCAQPKKAAFKCSQCLLAPRCDQQGDGDGARAAPAEDGYEQFKCSCGAAYHLRCFAEASAAL